MSITRALINNTPLGCWDLIFKPENMQKLQKCGVAILDNGPELLPAALNYLHLPHHSKNPADYKKAEANIGDSMPKEGAAIWFDMVAYGRNLSAKVFNVSTMKQFPASHS